MRATTCGDTAILRACIAVIAIDGVAGAFAGPADVADGTGVAVRARPGLCSIDAALAEIAAVHRAGVVVVTVLGLAAAIACAARV